MLKKLFYIGLGFSIIMVKKSVSYILATIEQSDKTVEQDPATDVVIAGKNGETAEYDVVTRMTSDSPVAEQAVDPLPQTVTAHEKQDDLTEVKGIGPTYAKRLASAGILTFSSLSKQTPDALRSITQARGQSADPESWIAQAVKLSD